GATDRRRGDAEQGVVGTDLGNRLVVEHDPVLLDEDRRLHLGCHVSTPSRPALETLRPNAVPSRFVPCCANSAGFRILAPGGFALSMPAAAMKAAVSMIDRKAEPLRSRLSGQATMDFIFMLTRQDETVEDCLEVFEEIRSVG